MSFFKQSLISLACAGALVASGTAHAKPSINDVQTCQAHLDFVDAKLASVKKYDKAQVKTVRKGLKSYNDFLQSEHVTPGLMALYGGDKAKVKSTQVQIDAYKKNVVAGLDKRYPQPRVFMDHAISIDACYTKAPMDASGTAVMTEALQTLVALSNVK